MKGLRKIPGLLLIFALTACDPQSAKNPVSSRSIASETSSYGPGLYESPNDLDCQAKLRSSESRCDSASGSEACSVCRIPVSAVYGGSKDYCYKAASALQCSEIQVPPNTQAPFLVLQNASPLGVRAGSLNWNLGNACLYMKPAGSGSVPGCTGFMASSEILIKID